MMARYPPAPLQLDIDQQCYSSEGDWPEDEFEDVEEEYENGQELVEQMARLQAAPAIPSRPGRGGAEITVPPPVPPPVSVMPVLPPRNTVGVSPNQNNRSLFTATQTVPRAPSPPSSRGAAAPPSSSRALPTPPSSGHSRPLHPSLDDEPDDYEPFDVPTPPPMNQPQRGLPPPVPVFDTNKNITSIQADDDDDSDYLSPDLDNIQKPLPPIPPHSQQRLNEKTTPLPPVPPGKGDRPAAPLPSNITNNNHFRTNGKIAVSADSVEEECYEVVDDVSLTVFERRSNNANRPPVPIPQSTQTTATTKATTGTAAVIVGGRKSVPLPPTNKTPEENNSNNDDNDDDVDEAVDYTGGADEMNYEEFDTPTPAPPPPGRPSPKGGATGKTTTSPPPQSLKHSPSAPLLVNGGRPTVPGSKFNKSPVISGNEHEPAGETNSFLAELQQVRKTGLRPSASNISSPTSNKWSASAMAPNSGKSSPVPPVPSAVTGIKTKLHPGVSSKLPPSDSWRNGAEESAASAGSEFCATNVERRPSDLADKLRFALSERNRESQVSPAHDRPSPPKSKPSDVNDAATIGPGMLKKTNNAKFNGSSPQDDKSDKNTWPQSGASKTRPGLINDSRFAAGNSSADLMQASVDKRETTPPWSRDKRPVTEAPEIKPWKSSAQPPISSSTSNGDKDSLRDTGNGGAGAAAERKPWKTGAPVPPPPTFNGGAETNIPKKTSAVRSNPGYEDTAVPSASEPKVIAGRKEGPVPAIPAANRSKVPVPPTPATNRSLPTRPGTIESEPWYFGDIERVEAEAKVISMGHDGDFIVRTSKRGGADNPYTLTLLYNGSAFNLHLRLRPDKNFALGTAKPDEHAFHNVSELINFHTNNSIEVIGKSSGKVKLRKPVVNK